MRMIFAVISNGGEGGGAILGERWRSKKASACLFASCLRTASCSFTLFTRVPRSPTSRLPLLPSTVPAYRRRNPTTLAG